MVRISSVAICAALLVAAPGPSFADAAPAAQPRQTLKPRYSHTYPKHIKRREFIQRNETTPALTQTPEPAQTPTPIAPSTTPVPVTHQDPSSNPGGIGIPGIVTFATDGGVGVLGSGVGATVNPESLAVGVSAFSQGVGANPNGISAEVLSQTAVIPLLPDQKTFTSRSLLDSLGLGGTSQSQQSGGNDGQTSASSPASQSGGDNLLSGLLGPQPNTQTAPAQTASQPANPETTPQQQTPTQQSSGGGLLDGLLPPDGTTSAPQQPVTTQPQQVDTNTQPLSQTVNPNTQPLSQTVDPNTQPLSQTVDPNTQPLSQTVDPNTQPSSQNIDPNTQVPITTPAAQPTPTTDPGLLNGLTGILGGGTTSNPATDVQPTTVPTDIPPTTQPQQSPTTQPLPNTDVSTPIVVPTPTDQTSVPPVTQPTDTQSQSAAPTATASPTDVPATTPSAAPTAATSATDVPATSPSAPATAATSATSVPATTASAPATAATSATEVPVTSASASAAASTSAASAASSAPESASAPATTASPATETPTSVAPTSVAPESTQASAVPLTTESPVATSVPSQTPTANSAQPTGTDSLSSIFVPTVLVTDSAPSSTFTPASTAAFSTGGIPTTMPHVITPPDSNGALPPQPPDTQLIQIGFLYALNYPFVLSHQNAVYQIFDILPYGLAYGLGIDTKNITMQSLQPYDTTRSQGFITTVALAYIPTENVVNLTISVPNRGSLMYRNKNETRHELMSVIDPNFPVLAGSDMINVAGTSNNGPATTSVIAEQGNPLANNQGGSVSGTAVGIGVGVCAGAAVYGAAMFFIAKRYKQRKNRHSRSSSTIDTTSEYNSAHAPVGGANTALMNDGPDGSYGTRGGSRHSNHSQNSSQRRQEISGPVMAENSLGWN